MAESLLSLRIIKTIIGLLGLFNNGLVLVVLVRVKFMHSLTNFFIGHQATIDLLGSLLLLLQSNTPEPSPLPSGAAGEVLCRAWIGDALLWLLFVTSTFNLLGLTLERYVAIVHPLRYRALFGRRQAALVALSAWLVGVLLKSYSFAIYAVVDGVCKFQRVAGSRVIGPLLIVLQYFLPAVVMLFCYIRITVSLKRGALRVVPVPQPIKSAVTAKPPLSVGITKPVAEAPAQSPEAAAVALSKRPSPYLAPESSAGRTDLSTAAVTSSTSVPSSSSSSTSSSTSSSDHQARTPVANLQQDSLLRARRNTFKTLVIVFVVFLLCWSPSQISFFMFNVGWLELDFSGPFNVFSTSMVALNCCINPVIYGLKYKQFQQGVRAFFCGRKGGDLILPRP